MAHQTSPAALQIKEDMAFQRRSWTAERIGWSVMALVIIAALLGLFAVGPLSWSTKTDASGLMRVDYGRIQRQTAPTTLKVDVALAAVAGESMELQVDQSFLEMFTISSMRPEPTEAVATSHGLRLRFKVEPGSDGHATIYFELSPETIGFRRTRLGLAGHEPVELPVFIHP